MFASRTSFRASDVGLRAVIVGLAVATGYIHSTLGGLLFTLNAAGEYGPSGVVSDRRPGGNDTLTRRTT